MSGELEYVILGCGSIEAGVPRGRRRLEAYEVHIQPEECAQAAARLMIAAAFAHPGPEPGDQRARS